MSSFEYEFRLNYFKKIWSEIKHKKVAIYGAGKHTEWFIHKVCDNLDNCIIIDEFSESMFLNGVQIFKPEDAPYIDIVVLSSDTQEAILEKKSKLFFPKTKVLAPYKNIGCGPFLTESVANAKASSELIQWKNKFAGQRCFIIGNGPSLNNMDLSLLKDEFTFGSNRIYLLFEQMGFETSFISSVNPHVLEQFQQDFNKIACPKFLPAEYRNLLKKEPKNSFYLPPQDPKTPAFHKDLSQGLWWGATVTFVNMQLAYFMGFQEVILIGVDHYFKDKGKANSLVKFENDDENHFSPDYFKGYQWQLPDLNTSELAYNMAKFTFEKAGRSIIDATIDGHLQIFEKVDYRSLFK